jgi:hypothetical protein
MIGDFDRHGTALKKSVNQAVAKRLKELALGSQRIRGDRSRRAIESKL